MRDFPSNLQVSGLYNRLILVLAFMHHGEQSVQTSKRMCTLTEGSRVFLYSVCSIFWWSGSSESWGVHALCTQSWNGEKNPPWQYLMRIYSWRWLQLHHCSIRKLWGYSMIALYESAWWHHHYCSHNNNDVIVHSCSSLLDMNNFCTILKSMHVYHIAS